MIKICPLCSGKGEISNCERFDEHAIECFRCEGTGRLHEQTFTLSLALGKKQEFDTKATLIINVLNSKL